MVAGSDIPCFADIDLTRYFQLFMVSMYFIVSGLFVMQSKW